MLATGPQKQWTRLGLTLTIAILYVLGFPPLYGLLGKAVGTLVAIPVVLTAWLFGPRVGLLASIAAIPLNTILLNWVGLAGWDALFKADGAPGIITLILVAAAIGRLAEVTQQLARELASRNQAEAARQSSETRARVIIENNPDGITLLDREGIITYHSLSAGSMLGYGPGELIGRRAMDLVHPDDFQVASGILSRLLQTPGAPISPTGRYRLRHKDGSWRWIDGTGMNMLAEPGVQAIIANFRDVTAYITADETIRESEERFRLLSEQSIMGLAIIQNSQIKYANQALADINGYSVVEIMQWNLDDIAGIIYPDDRAFAIEQARKKQRGDPDVVTQYTYRLIAKNQAIKWVDQYSRTITYHNQPADLIAMIDITEKIKAEQKLQESEERFRTLIENLRVGVMLHGPRSEIMLSNQAAQDLLGLTASQLADDKSFDSRWHAVHEDGSDFPLETRPVQQAMATKKPVYGVVMGVDRPHVRDRVWLLVNAEPRLYPDGTLQHVVCSFLDISDRRRAEEALRQSEERYRAISEMISDYAMCNRVEPDGTMISEWMTESFARVTGYTTSEMLEREAKERYTLFHPDDRDHVDADIAKLLGGEAIGNQYQIVTKSGETRWIYMRRQPIWDDVQQRVVRYYAVAQDITERKQAEAQLLELALVREREKVLREFLNTMSHDLKTPLSVINTSIYLLEQLTDPDNQKRRLETIKAQTKHLERLIQDILTMSRLDTVPDTTFKALDLNTLVLDVNAKFSSLVEKKNLTFQFNLGAEIPAILADEDDFRRALVNLVENALNYTPAGGSITVRTALRGADAIFEVSDTGIGIGEKDMPHIFEHFYRADKARATEKGGTGLGLAIVKKVVEIHGGDIEVESVLGQGSTFRIRLPIAPENSQ